MNYLAHLALSYPNEGLVVGNFIGDHVRNKDLPSFSASIQKGVEMHRSIDVFTDNHAVSKELRALLFDKHRHVARVLLDVFYDHFLAIHFCTFHHTTLRDFIHQIHPILEKQQRQLPLSAQHYLKGMVTQNWLDKYASTTGIATILTKMAVRSGLNTIAMGTESLSLHYNTLNEGFLRFYPDLLSHAAAFKKRINNT